MESEDTWAQRVAEATAARQALLGCCRAPGEVDAQALDQTFAAWQQALEALAEGPRLAEVWPGVDQALRWDVHALAAWREALARWTEVEARRALWLGWSTGEMLALSAERLGPYRRELLRLFAEAMVNAIEHSQPEDARDIARLGLDLAEAFLVAGESNPDVRSQALRLHLSASLLEHERGAPQAALVLYRAGLAQAERFLADGERAPVVRKRTLELYVNAGAIAHDCGDSQAALALYRAGLAHAKRFLATGERAPGVREQTLKLYIQAGLAEYERSAPQAELDRYRAGLAHAEHFLGDGEIASGVREQTLWLYTYASAAEGERGDWLAELDFCRQGLARASDFLTANETASGVRESTLWLYVNAGFAEAQRGDRLAVLDFCRQGLARANDFLAAGETAPGIRKPTLQMYINAGDTEFRHGDWLAALDFCRQGLEQARPFLAANETAADVRELTLRMYANAGATERARGDRLAALDCCRQGLVQATTFLAAGESASGVRKETLRLLQDAAAHARDAPTIRRCDVLIRLLTWSWADDLDQTHLRVALKVGIGDSIAPERDAAGLQRFESEWLALLQKWLLHYHGPSLTHLPAASAARLLRCGESLRLFQQARATDQFRTLFTDLLAVQRPVQRAAEAQAASKVAARAQLTVALARLSAPNELRKTAVSDPAAVADWLAATPWWQRWSPAWRQARQALDADRTSSSETPRLDDPTWKALRQGQTALARWLVSGLHEALGLPVCLETPAQAITAILLAAPAADPAATLARWQSARPWAGEPEHLAAALEPTGWATWLARFDTDEDPALYAWIHTLAHGWKLRSSPTLENASPPELVAALRAWRDGAPEPLVALLRDGWAQADAWAPSLARVLAPLATLGKDELPTEPSAETLQQALTALLLGRVEQAVRDWLEGCWPMTRGMDPDTLLQAAKARFAQVLTSHPGPEAQAPLAERLHAWRQSALGGELAQATPDPLAVWEHLEGARLALTGLTVIPLDLERREKALETLVDAMRLHWTDLPAGEQTWPPLAGWLTAMGDILPPRPTVEAAQARLRAGEALVQLYFAPTAAGTLEALWLTPTGTLGRRALPPDTALAPWQAGPLGAWTDWVRKEELPSDFKTGQLLQTLVASAPVTALCTTLADWAKAEGVQRLVLLFPAALAQLPWEAVFAEKRLDLALERAVALTHWRRAADPPNRPVTLAQGGVKQKIAYGHHELAAAATFWQIDWPPEAQNAPPPQVFDLMAQLHTQSHAHLVLHGHYDPRDPRASHLRLGAGGRLFAWTFPAIAPSGHVGLSACQGAVCGRSAQDWLGPVGLGPALLAAGVQRLTAALWRCDQLATWLLHRELYRLARIHPERTWGQIIGQAAHYLRELTNHELRATLEQTLGAAFNASQVRKYLNPPPHSADPYCPFADPYYWAGIVLLGEDAPVRAA